MAQTDWRWKEKSPKLIHDKLVKHWIDLNSYETYSATRVSCLRLVWNLWNSSTLIYDVWLLIRALSPHMHNTTQQKNSLREDSEMCCCQNFISHLFTFLHLVAGGTRDQRSLNSASRPGVKSEQLWWRCNKVVPLVRSARRIAFLRPAISIWS